MITYRLTLPLALAASMVFGVTNAMAASVYLYDNASTTSKLVNDIVVWKDAAATRNSSAFTAKTIKKVVCIAKPRSRAQMVSDAGAAIEVKLSGSCKGFVRKNLVHANK